MKNLPKLPGGDLKEIPRSKDLATLGDDDLEHSTIGLKKHIDAHEAELLLAIAEYDRRGLALERHLLGTTSWVRNALRMTARRASRLVKTAKALAAMPNVSEEAIAGNITSDGLGLLTRARNRHPNAFAEHEEVFGDVATYLSTEELRTAISHWEQQVDYPSALAQAKEARRRRKLTLSQSWDGIWHINGELDPETGALVDTALRSRTDPSHLRRLANGSTEHADEDRRFPWQRRADALAEICSFWLTHNDTITTSGGNKPHVTVTLDLETLLGLKDRLPTIGGIGVNPETVRRLTCDAGVVRIIVDAEGQPLDVGRRQRTVTPAIRRALDLRDGGCGWSGCDAPSAWCDAHHLVHWADGGPTSLENSILLCRRHHVGVHEDQERVTHARPP